MAAVGIPVGHYFRLSGHTLLRYGSAHLVDLVTAALRIQEDLAASHTVETEAEARDILGNSIRFQPGHRYLAGAHGIYVIRNNMAITYIDASRKFMTRAARGSAQRGRSGRLKCCTGSPRRERKLPV